MYLRYVCAITALFLAHIAQAGVWGDNPPLQMCETMFCQDMFLQVDLDHANVTTIILVASDGDELVIEGIDEHVDSYGRLTVRVDVDDWRLLEVETNIGVSIAALDEVDYGDEIVLEAEVVDVLEVELVE